MTLLYFPLKLQKDKPSVVLRTTKELPFWGLRDRGLHLLGFMRARPIVEFGISNGEEDATGDVRLFNLPLVNCAGTQYTRTVGSHLMVSVPSV